MDDQISFFHGDLPEKAEQAERLKKDINSAALIIKDGIARYKKSKLKARSKKQAEDSKAMFAELDEFASLEEIHDLYGYDSISESEYLRLSHLWEMREKFANTKLEFEDGVTKLLDGALKFIESLFDEEIFEVEDALWREEKEREAIARQLRNERQEYDHEIFMQSIRNERKARRKSNV